MKKFLFSDLYRNTKVIGFDLDGTLYDEFDFIKQVYEEIIVRLNPTFEISSHLLNFMLERWLEKGSSYPNIFKEAQRRFGLKQDFENFSLSIFRNFFPQLKLSERVKFVLNKIKEDKKETFLLTDGKEALQYRKIQALGLEVYFQTIIVTENIPKPNIKNSEKILKTVLWDVNEIVYIGDRDIDKEFAVKCGFHFIPQNNLI